MGVYGEVKPWIALLLVLLGHGFNLMNKYMFMFYNQTTVKSWLHDYTI